MMSEQVWTVFGVVQIFFALVIGIYFIGLIKGQRQSKTKITINTQKEQERLEGMRKIQLSEPLTARTRPECFDDVIGQEEGIKALRAAMCGPNPQHVIIYGPPGVGKTTVARLVLEEAKRMEGSPFLADAAFIEIDGATARFDERGIADPLIGSVHDPIYQGAGAMGVAGIPQPKPGAVTKAHGGVLYIDEIGELHPMQMNKLLKVLEDRKVLLESAYYSEDNEKIPGHIHDIFANGLPADFRLVAATTRRPEEIPAAIRSRCLEIYFRSLLPEEIMSVVERAAKRMNMPIAHRAVVLISDYATNGREAVNMVQIAAGMAMAEQRQEISREDVEWVINSCHYSPRPHSRIAEKPDIGLVNGLAVCGPNMGIVSSVEVAVCPAEYEPGTINVTGIVEEEELTGGNGQKVRRKSMARCSVENVCTALKTVLGMEVERYHIHVNFPGGTPIDGPSAGIAIATAVYSAISRKPVDNRLAMTGEVSIRGKVLPVGGTPAKVEAARQAGLKQVLIPKQNWQDSFRHMEGVEVIPVEELTDVVKMAVM